MKTIGLLGGMSWESTALYYREINRGVGRLLGGLHSAQIVLVSVDFEPLEALQRAGRWDDTVPGMVEAARRTQSAGADFLLITSNTMHRVAPQVEAAISIPLVHIADATAEALLAGGVRRVGLLGTAFTMEQDFYKGRLRDGHGLDVLVPDPAARADVHRVIYDELCLGRVEEQSRRRFLGVVQALADAGAEAVILGCTEIGLLVRQADTPVALYDTTVIHAERAVRLALEDDS